jgi:hypothetical protein
MSGLVLMVNRERVVFESLELARIRIARLLSIPVDKVSAQCNIGKDGDLQAKFEVDEEATKDRPPEMVKSVVSMAYQESRVRMKTRLAGLGDRRGNEEEKKASDVTGGRVR